MKKQGNKKCYIGFDLGGTKMMALVLDGNARVLARVRKKTKAHQGQEAGLLRIKETISEAISESGLSNRSISAIGIGCPGPLDLDKGIILEAPNLGWNNVHLKRSLQKHFSCPVIISNDVDAGVYGEYVHGAAKQARCVLGVFPGTGIGGGCVYNGEVIRGRRGSCMELGHMIVAPGGALCGCGQTGCLEAMASRLAISSAAARAVLQGKAPYLLDKSGSDLAEIRSSVLAESIAAGDKAIEQIVRNAARWLGIGIANTVNLLSPDAVILGGGLVEAMPEIYMQEVHETANQHVLPSFRGTFRVTVAELGDDATAIGAAAWAVHFVALPKKRQ